jgi:hypothetical protein
LENVDIFYGHLEYFIDVWNVLLQFGTSCVHLVHFFQFWYHAPRKFWQPCTQYAESSTQRFLVHLILVLGL